MTNSELHDCVLADVAPLNRVATRHLERALSEGRITGRGVTGVHRVALTIADLAGHEPPLTDDHIATALALRAPLGHVLGRPV